jgi:hypothetical protein
VCQAGFPGALCSSFAWQFVKPFCQFRFDPIRRTAPRARHTARRATRIEVISLTDQRELRTMPKFAANLTMLFNEVPFLDRFAAAADAGFNAVEFLFPYPYQVGELAERLQQNRLKLVLHNLPAGNWEAGERGIACLPDRVGEFQEGVGRT